VGSTKAGLCALGRAAFPADGSRGAVFVGSHPMAGSEKTGLDARDPLLFQNASWVLCPESEGLSPADAARVEGAADRVQAFAQALGARVTRMPARLHDEVAAHVSHLPQLLSTALASFVGGRDAVVDNCLQIAGGGFRAHLEDLESALDGDLGEGCFREANRLRARLSTARKGFALPLSEILVDLEDKPGELVRVFAPLAAAGLNVLDVEILKVREGEGGVLMLGFHGADEAGKAAAELAAAGFRARGR
jgi:prephenate dehydrogenase